MAGLGATKTNASTRTILDFATARRTQPAANLAVLGDGQHVHLGLAVNRPDITAAATCNEMTVQPRKQERDRCTTIRPRFPTWRPRVNAGGLRAVPKSHLQEEARAGSLRLAGWRAGGRVVTNCRRVPCARFLPRYSKSLPLCRNVATSDGRRDCVNEVKSKRKDKAKHSQHGLSPADVWTCGRVE
ncbi:hypothetical protein L1887_61820 [Cichorium endivia]|nr:hypothetical protein L1887_61820 [Cichorium endivia]